jgi:hypothetical protein
MQATMTITLSETDVRKLWERVTESEDEPPLGQDLADWFADHCSSTIESTFQFDGRVDPMVTAGCASETLDLLWELQRHADAIATGDEDTEAVRYAKIRHQEIVDDLVGVDDPELADHHLEILQDAYADLLALRKAALESLPQ